MIDSPVCPTDLLDRVDQLASALLDRVITEEQIRELGCMLEDEPGARRRYIQNMQLHTDLIEHYNDKTEPRVPVLGMLGTTDSLGAPSPVVVSQPK